MILKNLEEFRGMALQRIRRGGLGWLAVLLVMAGTLLLPRTSHAQVATADVTGTVTDSTGAAIPGAQITIENQGTHERRMTSSNATGEYIFTQLQPGTYSVAVSAPSFKSFITRNMVLAAGDRARVDAPLPPGASTETVTVTTEPSALQTDSTNVGASVDSAAIADLPLNGRNVFTIAQVSPGVNAGAPNTMTSGTRPDDRRQSSAISANGQYELFNNELIDGFDNNERYKGLILLRPSVEAIQTARVDTNLYTAEVSRTAGAAVNIITKSGSNDFHGSVYEFFRNDVTDARNFFASSNVLPRKPELRQNQFGGSMGGPILRNRTFFFFDLEEFRQVDSTGTVYLSTVPTLYEDQHPGDLADIGGTVTPSASIDPTALAYFKLYPAPNTPGTISATGQPINNFLYNPPRVQNTSLGDARIDHHFSANDLLWGRFSYNRVNTDVPGDLPGVGGVQPGTGLSTGAFAGHSLIITDSPQFDYTHIFTPRLVMELRASYDYFQDLVTPLNYGKNLNNTATYSIPHANGCLACSSMAMVSVTGYDNLGDAIFLPILLYENTYQYSGNLTYTRDNHTIKAGAGLIRRRVSNIQNNYGPGYIIFSGASPQLAMANLFKGTPFVYLRQSVLQKPYLRVWEPSVFVQDDWRARPNLTFNLGLRYDVFTAPNEENGNYGNLNLATSKLIVGPTAGVNTSFVNVAPRFGFAYTMARNTVVRGGFGLTFLADDIQNAFQMQNAPLVYSSGTQFSTTPLSSGIIAPTQPSTTSLFGAVTTKPANFRDAYVEQFNILVQRDFRGNVGTVGYVGELGRHIMRQIPNINLPPPPGSAKVPALLYASTLPKVNTIGRIDDEGTSAYHSLQASLERRLKNGLTINANYTWAHSIDDGVSNGADGEVAYGLQPALVNTYDRGNSFLDVRHRIAGTGTYAIAFPTKHNPVANALLQGWQFNALSFWQTGTPYSIASSVTQNGLAYINLPTVTTDRPNRIGSGKVPNPSPTHGYLNASAFVRQPIGTAGNAGRNVMYGPHHSRTDVSLFKTVGINDHLKAELHAECFNLTNTPYFAQPGTTITAYRSTPDSNGNYEATNSGNFGIITSTAPGTAGRQFQFAIKVLF